MMNSRKSDTMVTNRDRWELAKAMVDVLVEKVSSGKITTDEYNEAIKKLALDAATGGIQ